MLGILIQELKSCPLRKRPSLSSLVSQKHSLQIVGNCVSPEEARKKFPFKNVSKLYKHDLGINRMSTSEVFRTTHWSLMHIARILASEYGVDNHFTRIEFSR